MSLIPLGIDIAVADALDLINPVLFRQRNIGGFIADVTVEEIHNDVLEITRRPVEIGAAITDHSYMLPASVVIKAGWSNSSPQALGNPDYVNETYAALLALQATREPFDIVTGKRAYQSMLMGRINARTDERSENVLMLEVDCREVILVSTQTVSVPTKDQASPESTGGTTSRGTITIFPGGTFVPGPGNAGQ
jgi:hypothetical protein